VIACGAARSEAPPCSRYCDARKHVRGEVRLEIVPGTTRRFEEPAAAEQVRFLVQLREAVERHQLGDTAARLRPRLRQSDAELMPSVVWSKADTSL
jgi:hypothetical protein